jgi:hypothetical protein
MTKHVMTKEWHNSSMAEGEIRSSRASARQIFSGISAQKRTNAHNPEKKRRCDGRDQYRVIQTRGSRIGHRGEEGRNAPLFSATTSYPMSYSPRIGFRAGKGELFIFENDPQSTFFGLKIAVTTVLGDGFARRFRRRANAGLAVQNEPVGSGREGEGWTGTELAQK